MLPKQQQQQQQQQQGLVYVAQVAAAAAAGLGPRCPSSSSSITHQLFNASCLLMCLSRRVSCPLDYSQSDASMLRHQDFFSSPMMVRLPDLQPPDPQRLRVILCVRQLNGLGNYIPPV
jgi:hypothetical protein